MRAMLDTIHEISVALASVAASSLGSGRASGTQKEKARTEDAIEKEATHRPAQT